MSNTRTFRWILTDDPNTTERTRVTATEHGERDAEQVVSSGNSSIHNEAELISPVGSHFSVLDPLLARLGLRAIVDDGKIV